VHQVQIHVINTKRLERGVNTLIDALVPRVVEFGGEENLFAGDTRCFDTLANFGLVAIGKSSVYVAVTFAEGNLDSVGDFSAA